MITETLVEGRTVLIQRPETGEFTIGSTYGLDSDGRIVIRTLGYKGGEFIAKPELLERGFSSNPKGHLRFFMLPMNEEANKLFKTT